MTKKRGGQLGNTNGLGYRHTDAARKKMSLSARGNTNALGYQHTKVARDKMSKVRRGIPKSAEHRAKIGMANRGRVVSAETRKKIGLAGTGRRHTDEEKAKQSDAQRGRCLSDEWRAAISAGSKRHMEVCGGSCGRVACTRFSGPTRIENILVSVLLAEFPEVIREKRFGHYRVDAYLPAPYHLAFEADGTYWHQLPERPEHDAVRDAYLLATYELPVVRLTQIELLHMGGG